MKPEQQEKKGWEKRTSEAVFNMPPHLFAMHSSHSHGFLRVLLDFYLIIIC